MATKLFTPVEKWVGAPSGTLGFYQGKGRLSKSIENLEPTLMGDIFIPSHVFMKLDDDHVVEAILDLHVNSVAAVDMADNYKVALNQGALKLLIPPGPIEIWHESLLWLINTYGSEPYGLKVLFGFMLEHFFKLDHNPMGDEGKVCSQAAWLYLQHGWSLLSASSESLALGKVFLDVPESNSAPRNLYRAVSSVIMA